jgi:hypothetical protein
MPTASPKMTQQPEIQSRESPKIVEEPIKGSTMSPKLAEDHPKQELSSSNTDGWDIDDDLLIDDIVDTDIHSSVLQDNETPERILQSEQIAESNEIEEELVQDVGWDLDVEFDESPKNTNSSSIPSAGGNENSNYIDIALQYTEGMREKRLESQTREFCRKFNLEYEKFISNGAYRTDSLLDCSKTMDNVSWGDTLEIAALYDLPITDVIIIILNSSW